MGKTVLSKAEVDLLNEIDVQAHQLDLLCRKLDARSRTQGGVDGRWVSIGRTDLQKGVMALKRSIEQGPEGF